MRSARIRETTTLSIRFACDGNLMLAQRLGAYVVSVSDCALEIEAEKATSTHDGMK